MVNRRQFIRNGTLLGASLLPSIPVLSQSSNLGKLSLRLESYKIKSESKDLVADEDFWAIIRDFFAPNTEFINLENGYFSPQPQSTIGHFVTEVRSLNRRNSFFMRNEQDSTVESSKMALTKLLGISPKEFVICRNTTEALDTIIHGYPWKMGDEVLLSKQDYGSMQEAFRQEVKRHGIVLKYVSIPLNPADDDEVIKAYEKAITTRTRLALITHVINLTGQVLPVRKLTAMLHSKNVEVMLDAAHSIAHIDFSMSDLDVDYMGTSLHKWLCCPIGLGLLYIRASKIDKIWPLFGDDGNNATDIQKFEHHGTKPISAIATIPQAIEFHNSIGASVKEARLRFMRDYWMSKSLENKRFISNSPLDKERTCAIGNFSIDGIEPNDLAKELFDKYNIFSVAINSEEVKGVRITPHLYTNLKELDQLVDAIQELCS